MVLYFLFPYILIQSVDYSFFVVLIKYELIPAFQFSIFRIEGGEECGQYQSMLVIF